MTRHYQAPNQNPANNSTLHDLKNVPLKYLRFYEDVRPPYVGTFSKMPSTTAEKLARNPFARAFGNFSYDYDSEAEWEEPEEGEELGSEDEEDAEDDDDGDDANDIIDDEDAVQLAPRRQQISEDQAPKSTGLYCVV